MNGTELITYLTANAPALLTAVGPIVGAILTAVFLRSNTAANEFEKVKSGKFDEVIEDLLTSGQMTYTEFYKAKNFLKIAQKADAHYAHTHKTGEFNVYDFDWFIRYYEAAGNISDENMQEIWAKILAGEVKNPSTFSLSIIDVLRNMRKVDAELFIKVCKCSFDSGSGEIFLPNYDKYLDSCGIEYSDVMRLSEMGLIFNDALIAMNFEITPNPEVLFINGNLMMTIASQKETTKGGSIKQYPFTQVGKELATLVSESSSDENFLEFGKNISECKKYKVSIHKIINFEEVGIRHELVNLLEPLLKTDANS